MCFVCFINLCTRLNRKVLLDEKINYLLSFIINKNRFNNWSYILSVTSMWLLKWLILKTFGYYFLLDVFIRILFT